MRIGLTAQSTWVGVRAVRSSPRTTWPCRNYTPLDYTNIVPYNGRNYTRIVVPEAARTALHATELPGRWGKEG